ncbi:MAG: AbrB/MazE/SpoVT family DNA-binding domain-containing protein [Chromatiales bacterium]|jgi:AbrB family looped-hinge helix DNA binding protein
MPIVSSKRQITLPASQCQSLGINPGDEVEIFIANSRLTIVKKKKGAAKGMLKHVQGDSSVTDEESRQSSLL